ncbi:MULTISPECIES: hypothetical protein [Latilactobacillus]|uniref:hypothetical protein n=1 Tax=Latilactobacillus TaxID=2767885 RepID=UPI001301056E|nr:MULTISPECIES: hypothetical protein [Latilactobacillus]MDG2976894.1 hypothetical protein [Latilactobacillus curvatus]MDG2980287.1 hypothetical protein [Latilactobacillus curvatus]
MTKGMMVKLTKHDVRGKVIDVAEDGISIRDANGTVYFCLEPELIRAGRLSDRDD